MKKEGFSTEDFGVTVTLICIGFDLIGTNENTLHPKKVFFIFENTSKLQKAIQDYWDGKLRVDPQKWYAESRNVKRQLWGRKEIKEKFMESEIERLEQNNDSRR